MVEDQAYLATIKKAIHDKENERRKSVGLPELPVEKMSWLERVKGRVGYKG